MGAGAAPGLRAAMQYASQDDISQALSSLSAEDRSKIQEAAMSCSDAVAKPVLERKSTGEMIAEVNQQDFLQEAWKANREFFSGAKQCDNGNFGDGSGDPDEMWLPGQAQPDFLVAFDMGKEIECQIAAKACMFKVTKKSTGEQHEVAKYNKKEASRGAHGIKCSVEIRNKVSHPNVAKLLETFEDKEHIHLVFEGTFEKDLFDRLIENDTFKESQARIIMAQVFRALEHLHRHHVFSGKCIPENFRFTTPDPVEDPKNVLKLFDLFEARYCGPGKKLTKKVGSPLYVAAEVVDAGQYNELADMWSAGVIMFVCLMGFPPFWADNDIQIMQRVKIMDLKPTWQIPEVLKLSSDAQDLLPKLITRNIPERSTAEKALQHPWFNVPP